MKMKKRIASVLLCTAIVTSPIASIFNQDADQVLAWQVEMPDAEKGGSGDGSGGGDNKAKPFTFMAEESTIKDGEVDVPKDALFMLKFSNNASEEEVLVKNKEKIKVYEVTAEGDKLADYTITAVPKGHEDKDEFLYRRYIAINFNEYKPSTTYKIVVDAGVEAKNGTSLEKGFDLSFTSLGQVKDEDTNEDVKTIIVNKNARYLNGFTDGTIRPNAEITRVEVAKILSEIIDSAPDVDKPAVVKDLNAKAWYKDYTDFVIAKGIMSGDDKGNFRPNDKMTRAEFVTAIKDLINADNRKANTFTDLSENHWAYGNIMTAYNSGHVNGFPDNTFRPNANISRAEVAKVINSVIGKDRDLETNKENIKNYTDLETNHWAYKEVITGTLD